MLDNQKRFNIFALLLFVGLAYLPQEAQAQGANGTRRNSPYSRYGLGDVYSLNLMPNQMMGGAFSATYGNTHDINLQNPAGLGQLRYTAFELSGYYQRAKLSENGTNGDATFNSNDGNLAYLSLAFPITRTWERRRAKAAKDTTLADKSFPVQWGMSFGLLPHSRVAYDVAVVRSLDNIGEVKYNYVGQGSRFRVNWGNGFRYKNFSLGANVGFVFGTVSDQTIVDFQDSTYNFAFDNKIISSEFARGLLLDLGAQHTFRFKSDKPSKNSNRAKTDLILKIGAVASLGSNLSTNTNRLYMRSGTYYSRDTILNEVEAEGTIKLPLSTNVGIAFGRESRWLIGLNHQYTNWSTFSNSLTDAKLQNAQLFSIGGEWTPRIESRESYFERITYRAGAYFGQDGRFVENSQSEILPLQKYGINFGFTFPIETRVKSALSEVVILSFGSAHLGFEFGYLGHPDLIREKYFQVNVGFTINDDKWFKRTKFR
jgi:hypothetical protein